MRVVNIKIGNYENFVQTGTVSLPYFNPFPKIIVRVCDKNTKLKNLKKNLKIKKLILKMSKLVFNKIFFFAS